MLNFWHLGASCSAIQLAFQFPSLLQEKYNFKALNFHAKGFATKEEFKAEYGSDLYLVDIDKYDSICKVIPLKVWKVKITLHMSLSPLVQKVLKSCCYTLS